MKIFQIKNKNKVKEKISRKHNVPFDVIHCSQQWKRVHPDVLTAVASLLPPGGHAHTRVLLHEPEASAALHQAGDEEVPRGDRARGAWPWPDAHGRVREHEPDGLRPQRGHPGHARRKILYCCQSLKSIQLYLNRALTFMQKINTSENEICFFLIYFRGRYRFQQIIVFVAC